MALHYVRYHLNRIKSCLLLLPFLYTCTESSDHSLRDKITFDTWQKHAIKLVENIKESDSVLTKGLMSQLMQVDSLKFFEVVDSLNNRIPSSFEEEFCIEIFTVVVGSVIFWEVYIIVGSQNQIYAAVMGMNKRMKFVSSNNRMYIHDLINNFKCRDRIDVDESEHWGIISLYQNDSTQTCVLPINSLHFESFDNIGLM